MKVIRGFDFPLHLDGSGAFYPKGSFYNPYKETECIVTKEGEQILEEQRNSAKQRLARVNHQQIDPELSSAVNTALENLGVLSTVGEYYLTNAEQVRDLVIKHEMRHYNYYNEKDVYRYLAEYEGLQRWPIVATKSLDTHISSLQEAKEAIIKMQYYQETDAVLAPMTGENPELEKLLLYTHGTNYLARAVNAGLENQIAILWENGKGNTDVELDEHVFAFMLISAGDMRLLEKIASDEIDLPTVVSTITDGICKFLADPTQAYETAIAQNFRAQAEANADIQIGQISQHLSVCQENKRKIVI